MNLKLSEDLKSEILRTYKKEPISIGKLAKKFNLCSPTIMKVLKNVKRYPKNKLANPTLIEDFFEKIDTEEKAYFLGFIIADGNIFDYKSGTQKALSISQSQSDIYILEKFKESIKSKTKISLDKNGTSYIAVHSNKIAKDLENLGVIPAKSFYTYLPVDKIPDNMLHHVIRGIFDGDGSIYIKPYKSWYHKSVDISGSNTLINDISDCLYMKLNLKHKPKVNISKRSTLSYLRLTSVEDIYKFGEWIYKDATIYLKRKHERYLDFKFAYKLKEGNTELTE